MKRIAESLWSEDGLGEEDGVTPHPNSLPDGGDVGRERADEAPVWREKERISTKVAHNQRVCFRFEARNKLELAWALAPPAEAADKPGR